MDIEEVVQASRLARGYVKSQCCAVGLNIDFEEVERQKNTQRPNDHPYNLVKLAHAQGLLHAPDGFRGVDY
jgi:hypothetical protein